MNISDDIKLIYKNKLINMVLFQKSCDGILRKSIDIIH